MSIDIVAAFPATGKTHLAEWEPGIFDSDSSKFSWKHLGPESRVRHPQWPRNYMAHISDLLGRTDSRAIFVSTHAEVRRALYEHGLRFILVYPEVGQRGDYRERMERRGSPPALVAKVIDELWLDAIAECAAQEGCTHVVLRPGQYLADVWR